MTGNNDNDLTSLIYNLRSLSRYEHADLSIGDEAAATIDRLTRERDSAFTAGFEAAREEAAKVADAWCEKNGHPNGAWGIAAGIRSLSPPEQGQGQEQARG